MAKMYPPTCSPLTKSDAEKRYFQIMKTTLSDEWLVLHSVGLVNHPTKPWAEIDFVLIGAGGIYCLEMKGGRVRLVNGMWQFIRGDGHINEKHEGPFQQVGSASAALRNYLVGQLLWVRDVTVGYGVVVPDDTWNIQGPSIETDLVYDVRDTAKPFAAYLRRIEDFWAERLERNRNRSLNTLSEQERLEVLDKIRGDFDLRPSLRTQADLAIRNMLSLTRQQYKVLDDLPGEPRAIILGGAGSGKTVLAAEEARRQATAGQRTAFFCYSRPLATFLRRVFQDRPEIQVHAFHDFLEEAIRAADKTDDLPAAEQEDLEQVWYPLVFGDAWKALDQEAFDVLIIDEAQDLLTSSYTTVFDTILKGGMHDGVWRLFLDPFQDLHQAFSSAEMQRLTGGNSARYPLTVNCRNTTPIATAVALLSGRDRNSTLATEGPDVEEHWYRDAGDQRRQLAACMNRLLGQGLKPEHLVILSPKPFERSAIAEVLPSVVYPIRDMHDASADDGKMFLQFSTINKYKGLEADAVVVVDIDHLEDDADRQALYVAGSRARAVLCLFYSETVRPVYENYAFEYGQRLASLSEAPNVW